MSTLETVSTSPAAFVQEAERASNEYDLEALVAVYAPDAEFEAIIDGVRERHAGAEAIARAWRAYLPAMRGGRLTLRKELLAASEDGRSFTNLWQGRVGAGQHACGMEHWERNPDGLVVRHRMWSYLAVRDLESVRGRLRLLGLYPRLALAFDRARRSAR